MKAGAAKRGGSNNQCPRLMLSWCCSDYPFMGLLMGMAFAQLPRECMVGACLIPSAPSFVGSAPRLGHYNRDCRGPSHSPTCLVSGLLPVFISILPGCCILCLETRLSIPTPYSAKTNLRHFNNHVINPTSSFEIPMDPLAFEHQKACQQDKTHACLSRKSFPDGGVSRAITTSTSPMMAWAV